MKSGHNGSRGGVRFTPRVERLEDRTVPAGNVQVVAGDGILYVAGDDAGNQISIFGAGKGTVVIRSLDGTTTINGQTAPLFVKNVGRGYYVRTNGGDDVVFISGTRADGKLDVGTGDGNDTLIIDNAGHRKETALDTGAGNDIVLLNGSRFRGAVFLNTGVGDDTVVAANISGRDFLMTNPAGSDFFDNRGASFPGLRTNGAGFAPGARPTPPAPPPAPADTTPPTPTVSTSETDPTNSSMLSFLVNFDEDVSGFDAADLIVSNGTASGVSQISARSYSFLVTPAGQGAVSASVAAGGVTDAAGNANVASNSVSVTFDSVVPVVTINALTTPDATPTLTGTVDDSTATVRVTVAGQVLTATVSGNTWSVTVPTALTDATYPVSVTATDAAGNAGSASLANGLVVDASQPAVSFTTDSGQITSASTILFTATFSEAVRGVSSPNFSVTNATKGAFTKVDDRTYTLVLTPVADGDVVVTLQAGTVTDAAGNLNAEASFSFTVDTTAPSGTVGPFGQTTITGTSDGGTGSGVQTVEISIFDGTNYYTSSGAFDSGIQTFLAVTTTDNFATWSFAMPIEGTYTVRARITDSANNQVIVTQTVTVDDTDPTVTIDSTPTTSGAVTGTAADASGSGVAGVSATVFNGTNYLSGSGSFDSATPVSLNATSADNFATWSLTVPMGGPYDVVATATDAAGNMATDSRSVTVS